MLSEKNCSLCLKEGLIILVLLAVAVRFGGWTGVCCCVPGPVWLCADWAGSLGYWAIAFSLSCMIVYVAWSMGGGGSGACGVVASSFLGFLALELDVLEANWCIGVGDGSLLSFLFFYFMTLWFGLACLLTGASL